MLAMDLYVRHGLLNRTDPLVVELSEVLNALPIHAVRPDQATFRNPNGVAMKLANFQAVDTSGAAGLTSISQRDTEIWEDFSARREMLADIAQEIRTGIGTIPEQAEEGEDEAMEGAVVYRRHRHRERDPKLVKRKKRAILDATGSLRCEACGIDFEETYGPRGAGFIECHHTVPLATSGVTKTRIKDLVLLCSNCHRMVHVRKPMLDMATLRAIIAGEVERS
jgi:5-methylcytosine-specific restriction enzyme A